MKQTTCKIFSDASFDPLTGKCGYGVAIVLNDLCILKYGSIRGAKTSCEAEMLAAKKGIDYLNTKEFKKLGRPVEKVVFLSDNQCVNSFDQDSEIVKSWERRKNKERLIKINNDVRESRSKFKRGFRAIHIKGHTCDDKMNSETINRKLEFHYNNWCDQSARKNLRYGLRGKKIIHCQGFEDADKHRVEVPEGAFLAWKERLVRNLQVIE